MLRKYTGLFVNFKQNKTPPKKTQVMDPGQLTDDHAPIDDDKPGYDQILFSILKGYIEFQDNRPGIMLKGIKTVGLETLRSPLNHIWSGNHLILNKTQTRKCVPACNLKNRGNNGICRSLNNKNRVLSLSIATIFIVCQEENGYNILCLPFCASGYHISPRP